jgi:hypothetical protein
MRITSHSGWRLGAVLLATTLLVWNGSLRAELTDDELKCEIKTGIVVGKFVAKKMQCIRSCQQTAYANSVPPSDCVPPYAGATGGCVQSTEAKTQGLGKRGCSLDCPECYSGGDCNMDIDDKVAAAESHVESLATDVYCDDSGSTDGLTLSEIKCQHTVAKFVSAFNAKKTKCLAKCRRAEHAGKIPAGTCAPLSDPKTTDCIDQLEAKVTVLIDNKCETSINPSADKPECGLYATRTGADWVASEEQVVDQNDPILFCES